MKQFVITAEQLNKVMWLCQAACLNGASEQDPDKQLELLCHEIEKQELNWEFPTWGRPMNAQ